MAYTAADVKRLREETDAPMMECKTALEEADGDFERAKQILREKGKAAAAKRADRSTSAGLVSVAVSDDGHRAGGVVIECETDFVAKNEEFQKLAQRLAEAFRDSDFEDPNTLEVDGKTVATHIEEAVAKIRENIRLARAVHVESDFMLKGYEHHTGMAGAIVEVEGASQDEHTEIARTLAVQVVAMNAKFTAKDEIPASLIEAEIEVETQRAINEGKNPDMARQIAQGRVHKEYIKQYVLLEQPFYKEQSKSVSQYLAEVAKDLKVCKMWSLAVGADA